MVSTTWYIIPSQRAGVKWLNLLHWPYTLWHLSYIVIGASMAATINWGPLIWMLIAFALGMGVAAHAFDLVRGDPLKLALSTPKLAWVGGISLVLAATIGVWQTVIGAIPPTSGIFVAIGLLLVLGYNLEFWHMHGDWQFATWWAVFPVLVGYFTQSTEWNWLLIPMVLFAYNSAMAQRILSTQSRYLRRHVEELSISFIDSSGEFPTVESRDKSWLLHTYDSTLIALNVAVILVAIGLIIR